MDRVGQWCALCRGHEGKKDGDKGEGRKLAVVSVVSSSFEKNVLCLLHYAVRYLNDASATVKGIYLSVSLVSSHEHTRTIPCSYRFVGTSKTTAVRE